MRRYQAFDSTSLCGRFAGTRFRFQKLTDPLASLIRIEKTMKLQKFKRIATIVALLCTASSFPSSNVCAQATDFSQIDAFESMGTGTLRGASPPKTIVDDSERHTIFITIWESDTETKVYWKSQDGNSLQTTIISGLGVQAFQTAGELKLEALGDEHHTVKYGYVLLRLRKQ
jgi:hypothetical protein